MKSYSEYVKLREKYEDHQEERDDYKTIDEFNALDPNDYVIFGHLMKDITESVKSPVGREEILYRFGNEKNGYTIKTKMDVYNLMAVAICLSATLDKNISQDQLRGIFSKYHDVYAHDAYNQYKNVVELEMRTEKSNKQ